MMTAIAAAKKALEIGDVAADGWYCIGTKKDGSPLEMSPPTIMTWNAASDAQQGQTKRLPEDGELTQMYNALTSNPKALAAIAEGKIQGLDRSGSYPAGRVWGAKHNDDGARVLCSDDGFQGHDFRGSRAEARFVR
jgi:hypothetical protein